MPSNYTEHYQLSQWEPGDQVRRVDFNADNAKIDAAIKAESDARAAAVAALTDQLSKCGNCSVRLFTYTGTGTAGTAHPTQITFPEMPAFFIIAGNSALLVGRGGADLGTMSYEVNSYGHTDAWGLSWSGNTLSLSHYNDPVRQLNAKSVYTVVAFYITE